MIEFRFEGKVPLSKSLLIRNLICGSYSDRFSFDLPDSGEDVKKVIQGLHAIKNQSGFDCGDGAAVLRFLALRASREKGKFQISGTASLFSRPHQELVSVLREFGVEVELSDNNLFLNSVGWPSRQISIRVDRSISSQFASGIILNAWNFAYPIDVSWIGPTVSDGYLEMTLQLVESLGMQYVRGLNHISILPNQRPVGISFLEPDMSSAFTIAALAAVGGRCQILDFPDNSIQPDKVFVGVLDAMGAKVKSGNESLYVSRASELMPIGFNLKDSPDLFPVLAILCAFAKGKSKLYGAPHLAYKESNRLVAVCELLDLINRDYEPSLDGLVIHGRPFDPNRDNRFPLHFNPKNDHRLVMAGAIARQAGFNLNISNVKAVDKSFPGFKEITHLC